MADTGQEWPTDKDFHEKYQDNILALSNAPQTPVIDACCYASMLLNNAVTITK